MPEDRLIEVNNVTKKFPGVVALQDVSFDLKEGEVHALVGENGAGKSTLIKILSGAIQKTKGEVKFQGNTVSHNNPKNAMNLGIATIYQEFNLIPYLDVAENIYMGKFPIKNKITKSINKSEIYQKTEELFNTLEVDIKPDSLIKDLGVAQQQMVEIAKALSIDAKVYIMDEPTAALSGKEIDELLRVVNKLKNNGTGILYISHRLEEVFEIADRVTVLRDGKKIGTNNVDDVDKDDLIKMMVGTDLGNIFPDMTNRTFSEQKTALEVQNLTKEGIFKDININVKKGEIVGIGGLVGSKRTEVARAIFGADSYDEGNITLNDSEINHGDPFNSVKKGLCYLPEDRKELGLVLISSVKDNIALPSIPFNSKLGIVNDSFFESKVQEYVDKLNIRTPNIQQECKSLSGGNQQKVVIAKWLVTECDVFIFDEPTRGIDIGAKQEIYGLIKELANQGAAVIMISSELPEIVNLPDRVYVMRNGSIVQELDREKATKERILSYAFMED